MDIKNKQLKDTVIEISSVNNISRIETGKKLVKDIESQSDDKLGFEARINEIKEELKKLEDEVPGYKERLQSQVNAFGVLQYLYKFGVTDDDIINMSHIVTAYLNGNITFNPDLQSDSLVDENKLKKIGYRTIAPTSIPNKSMSIPKQANKSTIAVTLNPASSNITIKASTVANRPIAAQISAVVAVPSKPNAIAISALTSAGNASKHASHTVGLIGGRGVSPSPFVLLSSLPLLLPTITSPLLPTEPVPSHPTTTITHSKLCPISSAF